MTDPNSGPDSGGSLPDQRRPTPGESAPGTVRRGSFGAHGSGDTSGFGGLVRRPAATPSAQRPYGGWFDELADVLEERIGDSYGVAVRNVSVAFGELTIHVERDRIVEFAQTLRDDPALRFELCSSVSGVDHLGTAERFHVSYHLTSLTYRRRIRLEVSVPESDPHVPSVTSVYPTADWQERETYDMFGIVFDGHPALTRILMPDDWDGHPQRKDYALGGIAVEFKDAMIPAPDTRRAYK